MAGLFLHMPKCAGSSVLKMLRESIPDRLEEDYGSFFGTAQPARNDLILESLLSPETVVSDKVVYGHFFPVKYLGDGQRHDHRLVTILRDPITRLHSHYKYWNATENPGHYLWRRMKAERWTFEQFAFSPEMRNFYSQYFSQISPGSFAYIGLYEDLERSVRGCFSALGLDADAVSHVPRENVTVSSHDKALDPETQQRLREHHRDDYLLYRYAKLKFHPGSVDGAR